MLLCSHAMNKRKIKFNADFNIINKCTTELKIEREMINRCNKREYLDKQTNKWAWLDSENVTIKDTNIVLPFALRWPILLQQDCLKGTETYDKLYRCLKCVYKDPFLKVTYVSVLVWGPVFIYYIMPYVKYKTLSYYKLEF